MRDSDLTMCVKPDKLRKVKANDSVAVEIRQSHTVQTVIERLYVSSIYLEQHMHRIRQTERIDLCLHWRAGDANQ